MTRTPRSLARLREAFPDTVFTVRQAAEAGVSAPTLRRLCAQRRIVRVIHGRYSLDAADGSREAYLRRARALAEGAPLAASAAAAAWGLPCPHPHGRWEQLPSMVCAPREQHLPKGLRRTPVPSDLAPARGATGLALTAVDVARSLPAPEALIVVDATARMLAGTADRSLLASRRTRERARDLLLRAAGERYRCRGVRRAREIVALADPAAESPPESFIRGHLHVIGAPAPVANPRLAGASGRTYYADLYWPDHRLVVEIDGAVKYRDSPDRPADPDALVREKRRMLDLERAGIAVIRFTAGEVLGAPQWVARSILNTLPEHLG